MLEILRTFGLSAYHTFLNLWFLGIFFVPAIGRMVKEVAPYRPLRRKNSTKAARPVRYEIVRRDASQWGRYLLQTRYTRLMPLFLISQAIFVGVTSLLAIGHLLPGSAWLWAACWIAVQGLFAYVIISGSNKATSFVTGELGARLLESNRSYQVLPSDMQTMVDPIMERINSLAEDYAEIPEPQVRDEITRLLDGYFSIVETWRKGERQQALNIVDTTEYIQTRLAGLSESYGVDVVHVSEPKQQAPKVSSPVGADCFCARCGHVSSNRQLRPEDYPIAPSGPAPGARPVTKTIDDFDNQICQIVSIPKAALSDITELRRRSE